MNKKLLISLILFISASIIGVFLLSSNKDAKPLVNEVEPSINQIIFFYGDGCPHCAIVEEYFQENNIKEKVSFTEKEVYNNQKNSQELLEKARICGIPTDSIGVPFLWDGAKCLVGDQDIIEFFDSKIKK